ncbi:MAG TPA: PH domain-containing protein [Thermoleophilaceae bacterium]|nr:PH domain-containing protein [Thermoleophilaceae bacterium]
MEPATPEPTQRLPGQARLLFAGRSLGWAVPLVVGSLIVDSVLAESGAPDWIGLVLVLAAIALALLGLALEPQRRWRNWRYELRDEEIDLRRGVLVITRTLIPTIRVQHVDTQRTWLSDQLGLRSVRIHTAGGSHTIPALRPDEAAAIRDRIAKLAQRPDDV